VFFTGLETAQELIGLLKVWTLARPWWLMPVILATEGGRDQEDHGSKPAQANCLHDPISKKPITKKKLVEWLQL
jgi:hypothetical protein